MNMKSWLNARCAQLLRELDDTPLTDDCDEVRMKLLMGAMRESSVEMFHRAAENSRREIDQINAAALQEKINVVNDEIDQVATSDSEKKPDQKITLKSSVIRRVDSF